MAAATYQREKRISQETLERRGPGSDCMRRALRGWSLNASGRRGKSLHAADSAFEEKEVVGLRFTWVGVKYVNRKV